MRSNCPMYQTLSTVPFPEGPIDIHNPFGFDVLDEIGQKPPFKEEEGVGENEKGQKSEKKE